MDHDPHKICYIYALTEPRGGEIRYVGIATNPERRFTQHIKEAEYLENSTHKCHWIRSLQERGIEPGLRVLEETTLEKAGGDSGRESFWEQKLRAEGHRLTNTVPCGGLPPVGRATGPRSEEFCEKQRKNRLGYKFPEEGKQNMHGHKWSDDEERVRKHSEARKGKPIHSEEEKAKRRERMKGNAYGTANRGRKNSKETKQKMSEAKKGKKPLTKEGKHIRTGKTGHKQSEGQKAKSGSAISEARKCRRYFTWLKKELVERGYDPLEVVGDFPTNKGNTTFFSDL